MKQAGLVFAALLVFVLAVECVDECLVYSWAPSQVNALAEVGADLEAGVDFAHALSQLWEVFASSSNPEKVSLYYGLDSGNFYSVANCMAPVYANSAACEGSSQYIFEARNRRYFGDSFIHAFKTDGNGNLVGGAYYASSAAYDPTARPWYKQGSGWTDTYTYADGEIGVTYYHSFSGGVAGGDRTGGESCGPCLDGSFSIPWAVSWAASQKGGADIQTLFDIQAYAQAMIAHVKSFSAEIFKEVYIGFDNGNYYSVGDCRNAAEGCQHEGYKLYTRNSYVFNNDSVVTFQLDTNGKFASKASYGNSYDPRTRPWYTQGQGWTATYLSKNTNTFIKSYASPLKGGVTAASIDVDNRGNCYQVSPSLPLSFSFSLFLFLSLSRISFTDCSSRVVMQSTPLGSPSTRFLLCSMTTACL
jgi:hypothetical protein